MHTGSESGAAPGTWDILINEIVKDSPYIAYTPKILGGSFGGGDGVIAFLDVSPLNITDEPIKPLFILASPEIFG